MSQYQGDIGNIRSSVPVIDCIVLHVLIAVDVGLFLEFVPAIAAKHPHVLRLVAVGSPGRKRMVDMAALVDRLAADLAAVVGHFQSQVALGIAVIVSVFVSANHSDRRAAYPDVDAE